MKSALIIGASGYIGGAITRWLGQKGYTVTATFHKHPIEPRPGLLALPLDLESQSSQDSFLREIEDQRFAGIVFSFAYLEKEILKQQNDALMERQLRVYSINLLHLIRKLLAYLDTREKTNIVFIGSLVGLKSVGLPPHYAMAKSCIRGLVESLSKELGQMNVLVNSVDPGMLESGVSTALEQEKRQDYLSHSSLKRFGTADEVARVVEWVLDENSYISGKSFLLDGGL